jgi:gliding motility-associated-like protein
MKSNQYLLLILLIFSCWQVNAQQENDIWYFGLRAALDFRTGTPVALPDSEMISREGCASVSSASGELLFYTNGIDVWNSNHEVMLNGSGLFGGRETSSTHQALIVPIPKQPFQYYIFTTDERAQNNGIRYSQVDMRLNEGLGDITLKNELLYAPSTERQTLARHSNGSDFWLISHDWNSDAFYMHLINKNGIQPNPVIRSIGFSHDQTPTSNQNSRGGMQVSKQSDQLAIAIHTSNLVETFAFNPCNGGLSSLQSYAIDEPYGVCFSPNGQFLYISNLSGALFQVELSSQTIQQVGQTSGNQLGAIRLANDGKLYVAIASSGKIGVIHAPDSIGATCHYEDKAIDLGTGFSGEGLPQRIPFTLPSSELFSFEDATITLSTDCIKEPIIFSVASADNIDAATWQINDLVPIRAIQSSLTLRDTGNYSIQVIFSNECQIDTLLDTFRLQTCAPPIFLPNVFTPNFDGNNDIFEPKGQLDLLTEYELTIFSRWGERVFSSTDPYFGWNGSFDGEEVGEGVYVWMLRAKYQGLSNAKIWSGDVTLMR